MPHLSPGGIEEFEQGDGGWLEKLPTLNAAPAFYAGDKVRRDSAILPDQPEHHARKLGELRKREGYARNAEGAIGELPAVGVSFHGIMAGGWDVWSIVHRTLALAAPATIAEINISTLGYSPSVSHDLGELIDAGKIGRATFLCSHYFRSHYGDLVEATGRMLKERGGRFAVSRTHAKVICMETTGGGCFVFEGSANLRSCKNVEQYAFIHDRGLMEWHRRWMVDLLDKIGEKP